MPKNNWRKAIGIFILFVAVISELATFVSFTNSSFSNNIFIFLFNSTPGLIIPILISLILIFSRKENGLMKFGFWMFFIPFLITSIYSIQFYLGSILGLLIMLFFSIGLLAIPIGWLGAIMFFIGFLKKSKIE